MTLALYVIVPVMGSSTPAAARPALLDENPNCGESNGVFFVSNAAFPDDNTEYTGSNCGVPVARFLPRTWRNGKLKKPLAASDPDHALWAGLGIVAHVAHVHDLDLEILEGPALLAVKPELQIIN